MHDLPEVKVAELTLEDHSRSESDMIKELLGLQEKRCVTYNILEDSMEKLRSTRQMCSFTGTMKDITDTFNNISQNIIKIKEELNVGGFKESASDVEKLQELEESKLKLTAEEHIKIQSLHTNGDDESENALRMLKNLKFSLMSEITDVLEELRCRAYDIDM